jgi:DNA-binding protein HU-beta
MAGELFSKKNLVEAVLKEFEMTNKDATAIVDLMLDTVAKQLKKGNKVQLYGFGTFTVGKRAARKGRNPKTGEALKIKASKTVKFKASTTLKASV